jgi:dephospho-CoA kinase
MYRVGLTGNVAAGKSTVTDLLAAWGAHVVDADQLVRQLQSPGQPVFEAIVERFGSDMVTEEGQLDRGALRRLILSDDSKRESLNALVHPAVETAREEAEERAGEEGVKIIVHSIPLLFEVMNPQDFDGILLVDAPEATRKQRLIEIRGMEPSQAEALIQAQIPALRKRDRATWIIDNAGPQDQLEPAARQIWEDIQGRAAGIA